MMQMFPLLPELWIWSLVVVQLCLYSVAASPSVNVALQASFNAPPFILELLETAAQENSTAYFPLVDRIAEGRFAECGNDQELYETFLEILKDDGHLTSEDALSSFKFALSMHSAAPRIEAHYQYYDTSVEPSMMVAQDAACPVWVHFDGNQYCSPALDRAQQDVGPIKNPEPLAFDRVLGETSSSGSTPSILYADIMSPLFSQFHRTVVGTARDGQTSYRIRYRRTPGEVKPLSVNGYGIGLALKRTDYIVIDDRKAEVEDGNSVVGEDQIDDETIEGEEMSDLKPLSASDLLGLGLKTSSYIMASKDPFATLERVSQDFPKYSSSIAKRNATQALVKEHTKNRATFLPAGYNVIFMNGQQVQAREMDAFSLLEQLRRERAIVGNLRDLGFTGSEAVQVLSHIIIAESQAGSAAQRYDYRDNLEDGKVVIWLNDIEKDKRYKSWPARTSALLQRTWPGQLPQVRRNINHVVLPVDLSTIEDVELVVEQIQTFVKRLIPIRFAIVPMVHSAPAIEQAKIIYYLQDTYGLGAVMSYLDAYMKSKGKSAAQKGNFNLAIGERAVRKDKTALDYQAVIDSASSQSQVLKTQSYLKRLAADSTPAPVFVNGVAMARNDAWLNTMSSQVDVDLRQIQNKVYDQVIGEDTNLADECLVDAVKYRNALIVPENENSVRIIDMGDLASTYPSIVERLPRLSPVAPSGDAIQPELYIVADLDSKVGGELLAEALALYHLKQTVELVIIHNPAPSESQYFPFSAVVSERMQNLAEPLDSKTLVSFLALEKSMEEEGKLNDLKLQYPQESREQARAFWEPYQSLVRYSGLEAGQNAIIFNGRVVGPIPHTIHFDIEDFKQLLLFEQKKRLEPANRVLAELTLSDRIKYPHQASVLVSTIALSTISDIPEGIFESAPTMRMDKFNQWAGDHTLIQTGDAQASSIHLVASIDPTSQIAQRWIPIIRVLSELQGVHVRLYLNPREKMQELPIKRFYRHVLDSKPSFTADGELRGLQASFDRLPKEALLNLALDVPPAWLVAPKASIHDLDNIKLSALKEGANVDATYELEHILIEGHSRDVTVGPPPRGVQLFLGTDKDPEFADTIIMANLGYFQFKANPGYWNLRLQPGRSSKIFHIDSAGQIGYNPAPGDESTDITLMSFKGKTLYPRLSRRPGQETEDVLEESSPSLLRPAGSAMEYVNVAGSFASSLLSNIGVMRPSGNEHADINIFSVASGHLYERMLNIMMVSVLRHTTHSVKFWFIEQFLSPSFKASLPHLAAHYNFRYQLVTYKWPHWLRQQSEKQREIWGYKILFLDVLFPTSLDKVIFVDADQIVRTDMYDLVQLDLEGAPYGFTPMCDSRTEMEGFRFWKQGYWANFLRGLPYHISALYVVDLRKFREIAAGDRLRGQYHQLSADPASLSNLDQDLPNHMQHVLKIKSLPQEWLWCETWCSDEALKSARTIDLCNNPETKEPKLSRARRQVPEWTELDEEIAGVLKNASAGEEVRGGVQEVMVEGKKVGEDVDVGGDGKENVQKEEEGEARIDQNKDEL